MNTVKHREACGICDQEKEKGIHLYNLFICCECEQKMVHTEPQEAQYQFYLNKLKNINKSTLYS
ncbi:sigma factor G inhibitor Gin [Aquibacillus kalidii]|uniref:sigma factor G inhibitor Gin n=1 Tax=Aquibacillus kalidii TaxID=2762597 RepID=UPI0016495626|nr:sigma factor G inhibitor Gin [Aquibacillus kalidii]